MVLGTIPQKDASPELRDATYQLSDTIALSSRAARPEFASLSHPTDAAKATAGVFTRRFRRRQVGDTALHCPRPGRTLCPRRRRLDGHCQSGDTDWLCVVPHDTRRNAAKNQQHQLNDDQLRQVARFRAAAFDGDYETMYLNQVRRVVENDVLAEHFTKVVIPSFRYPWCSLVVSQCQTLAHQSTPPPPPYTGEG